MAEDKNKQLFLSLIYSFQMQTMMQLGKLANPVTGKAERELDGAQVTIDMLDMIKEKTKGNISDDESKFLDHAIADLKLNYVEERDKDKSDKDKTDKDKTNTKTTAKETDESKDNLGEAPVGKPPEKPEELNKDDETPVPPQE